MLHLHLRFHGMHPLLRDVSGIARVGAPVYFQLWIVLVSPDNLARLHICGCFGSCTGGLPVALLLQGRVPDFASSLVPLWWVLSGTPLILPYWTGTRLMKFCRLEIGCLGVSFAPLTLN
jgi:hypothetical protein